jgi:integrase
VIQERLGHASIQITLDTYSHLFPNSQQEAIGKLASFYDARAV